MSKNTTPTSSNVGPYRILRPLTSTSTGMGDVFLAKIRSKYRKHWSEIDEQVVLKASKDEYVYQDRLRKEVDLLQRCQHPNIVRIFPDPTSSRDNPFYTASYNINGKRRYQYAMEYVGRYSAEERMRKKKGLRPQEVIQIGVDIAKALEHVHGQRILNLDVKPSNIVLRNSRFADVVQGRAAQAVLCDFGTARFMADRAHSYGTDGFASPEQFLENQGQVSTIDQRSDLFSLGASLYALLTGRPPHLSSAAYVTQPIDPPSRYNKRIPKKIG